MATGPWFPKGPCRVGATCKPSSVHRRSGVTTISLGTTSRRHSSDLPAFFQPDRPSNHPKTIRERLCDLARGGVCHAPRITPRPVRSYRTFSPLPDPRPKTRPSAVQSLWHFPSMLVPRIGRALPATVSCRARTFLVRDCSRPRPCVTPSR